MSLRHTITLILFLITSLSTLLYFFQQKEEKEEEDKEDIKPPTFSHASGFYPDNFTLKLSTEKKQLYFIH